MGEKLDVRRPAAKVRDKVGSVGGQVLEHMASQTDRIYHDNLEDARAMAIGAAAGGIVAGPVGAVKGAKLAKKSSLAEHVWHRGLRVIEAEKARQDKRKQEE